MGVGALTLGLRGRAEHQGCVYVYVYVSVFVRKLGPGSSELLTTLYVCLGRTWREGGC